ncbi:MAG: putative N-acetylmannosamine-6-phosphate 2-epimerase [Maritimibacter sp.]|nr:putative N-acetylmannosamine-6-phosphate 2-epimerase [Maritimibacter sp.]
MSRILDHLRGHLVVSCQPVVGGPLDRPEIAARFALAALDGGARGLRIEGIDNLEAVRAVTDAPIIGLIKSDRTDTDVRITATVAEAQALARTGADIVAFDATDRPRPAAVAEIVAAIHAEGRLAMADCATIAEGRAAAEAGCAIVGSTLSGYTGANVPDEPDFALVEALAGLGRFVIAEGRYNIPDYASRAIRAGADAVVVGSAITRPEHITSWFVRAIAAAEADRRS